MDNNVNKRMRFYAVVGDNGYAYASCDGVVFEAMEKLKNISIMEFKDEGIACQYAVCAYCNRFLMRNFSMGISSAIPINLTRDTLFIDVEFEKREGEKNLTFFPGIPM